MYEFFNIFCFYPTRRPLNPLVGIVNALMELMTHSHKLLRFLIIVADKAIIDAANYYEFSINNLLQRLIAWLHNQAIRALRSRKDNLLEKKPGALTWETPQVRIVWVKMFNRSMFTNHPNKAFVQSLML